MGFLKTQPALNLNMVGFQGRVLMSSPGKSFTQHPGVICSTLSETHNILSRGSFVSWLSVIWLALVYSNMSVFSI